MSYDFDPEFVAFLALGLESVCSEEMVHEYFRSAGWSVFDDIKDVGSHQLSNCGLNGAVSVLIGEREVG